LANKFSGRFIVLDGPDGCGKTTQAERLAQWFQQQGVAVEIFRDPGATAIGEKIRQVLLNPEHIAMNTVTEVLLYMASRAQLWVQKLAPALQAGKCVVLDRWLSSTCAYQGYAGGFGMDKVIKIAIDSLERPWPDLTVILDVEVETGSARLTGQPDRMEQKGKLYHQKVREGFLKLAQQRKDFAVVDANEDIETVHKKVIGITEEVFL
jgi:dTMP kinase